MANPTTAFGLAFTRNIVGTSPAPLGQYLHQASDGTALFRGDPVVTASAGAALGGSSGVSGVPDGTPICQASGTTTTTAIRGVVEGVFPTLTNLSLQYCAASTATMVQVRDDDKALFAVMSNGTGLVGDISDTMGLTSGSGSTTTGLSAYVATESTGHAAASDVLRIIRLLPQQTAGNTLGANNVFEVYINLHSLRTTGVS